MATYSHAVDSNEIHALWILDYHHIAFPHANEFQHETVLPETFEFKSWTRKNIFCRSFFLVRILSASCCAYSAARVCVCVCLDGGQKVFSVYKFWSGSAKILRNGPAGIGRQHLQSTVPVYTTHTHTHTHEVYVQGLSATARFGFQNWILSCACIVHNLIHKISFHKIVIMCNGQIDRLFAFYYANSQAKEESSNLNVKM